MCTCVAQKWLTFFDDLPQNFQSILGDTSIKQIRRGITATLRGLLNTNLYIKYKFQPGLLWREAYLLTSFPQFW